MKKVLLLIMLVLSLVGCSSNDDAVESGIYYIVRNTNSGDNVITGTFCFFQDGDYDPSTFTYRFSATNPWQGASLKTTDGKTVNSFYIDTVLKDKGSYGTYKLSPGTYYMVTLVSNASLKDMWKAQKITITEGVITSYAVVFSDMYKEGYVE